MAMNFKKSFVLFTAVVMSFALSGCFGAEANTNKPFSVPDEIKVLETGTVAENENYSLLWDGDAGAVLLYDNADGEVWSSVPYDYYRSGDRSNEYQELNLCSSFVITYSNKTTMDSTAENSFDAVRNGDVYSLKIKNGVRVIYYFRDAEISLPVDYILCDDGLETRILADKITEVDNILLEVAVMPYFASAKNNTDSYLFVPSGCGALMYVDDTTRNIRNYSESVYGDDAASQPMQQLTETETVRLPVFSVKDRNRSLMGIIENGAELAKINAVAGDSQIGYSAVYPSFRIRSTAESVIKGADKKTATVKKVTLSKAKAKYLSVRYCPIKGYENSYNGVAAAYRDYLGLTGEESSIGIMLNVIGGINVSKSFLGIPYNSVSAAARLDEIPQMLNELTDRTDADIAVKLSGFGKGGLDGKKLAGGFKIDPALGSIKKLNKLYQSCEKQGIPLIMDFDLIYFRSSTSGFSKNYDSAKTADLIAAQKKSYSMVTHQIEDGGDLMLSRDKLIAAGEKLKDKISDWKLSGVSFSSLGTDAYGDCNDTEYYAKNRMSQDAAKILSGFKNGVVATAGANLYAAMQSDIITDTPEKSSGYNFIDAEIPFYQMIFKGSKLLTSPSVNLSSDKVQSFLKAVSTGQALEFTVIRNFENSYIFTANSGLSSGVFRDVKNDIIDFSNRYNTALRSVKGAQILKYEKQGELAHTVFSNGTEIYVNFGAETAVTPFGSVKGFDFISKEGNSK